MSYSSLTNAVHNAYTPKEAIEISSRAGAYKAKMRIDKILLSAFMAGALLSFAGACNVTIQTSPWYQQNAPGLIKMFGALVFPFGLVVIVMTGADLATGSFMVRYVDFISSPRPRSLAAPNQGILANIPWYSTPRSPPCTAAPPSWKC